jgi:transcriptional regulator with XRE-family HTH domain
VTCWDECEACGKPCAILDSLRGFKERMEEIDQMVPFEQRMIEEGKVDRFKRYINPLTPNQMETEKGIFSSTGESIGRRIARLRKAKGHSQSSLAESCGLSPGGMNQIEWDKSLPRSSSIQKIAEALGVTPGYLVTGFDAVKAAEDNGEREDRIAALEGQVKTIEAVLSRLPSSSGHGRCPCSAILGILRGA